jgi:hypothetical protein
VVANDAAIHRWCKAFQHGIHQCPTSAMASAKRLQFGSAGGQLNRSPGDHRQAGVRPERRQVCRPPSATAASAHIALLDDANHMVKVDQAGAVRDLPLEFLQ